MSHGEFGPFTSSFVQFKWTRLVTLLDRRLAKLTSSGILSKLLQLCSPGGKNETFR